MAASWWGRGREAWIRYDEPGEPWHQRILVAPASPEALLAVMATEATAPLDRIWWVLTPDDDVYPEELSAPPLLSIVFCDAERARIPRSQLGPSRNYARVHVFTALPVPLKFVEISDACLAEEARVARAGAAAAPEPAAREEAEGRRVADEGAAAAEEDAPDEEMDVRILAISRNPEGVRHKEFRDAVEQVSETTWSGWPISGPRTVMWCLRHILATDGTPRAHHTRWKHQGGLGMHEAGVGDHEACMRAFEFGL